MALHIIDWDMTMGSAIYESRNVLVDVVQLPGERGDVIEVSGIRFPGLFVNQLRDDCFSPDGKYIVTTTEWGSVNKIVSISLVDGTISPINFDLTTSEGFNDSACQQFICFADDGSAIVTQAEPNCPTLLGQLLPTFLEDTSKCASSLLADMSAISSTSFSSLEPDCRTKAAIGYRYQLLNTWPAHGDIKVPIGSILLLPEGAGEEKLPLIVVPHGGPHTCMSTSYVPSYSFLCKNGRYAILHVNFRGSTGFGQAALESLAGTAGTLDVLDVVAATRSVIDTGFIDLGRVGICGGSHGGFLAGHCIGQHPDLFKVAAMRNPCTNIASMVTSTDIPDW
jgi:acylaminoacyl-peptidase